LIAHAAAALLVALQAPEPSDDARSVAVLLAERCQRCHGPEKQKARLRLDQSEGLLSVVVPRDPAASPLWERVSLPPGHEDVMPPEGETLAPDELALVRRWIEAGAPAAGPDPAPDPRSGARVELERLAAATGALVLPVDPGGDPRGPLRVEFAYAERAPEAAAFAALAPVAERIAELGLAGTAVAPGTLAALPPLPALERAHLERTALGDADASTLVERAPNLRYLNLHSTAVTDAAPFAQLERVVLYGTPAESSVTAPVAPFAEGGPRRILISDPHGGRIVMLRETALGHFDVLWELPAPAPEQAPGEIFWHEGRFKVRRGTHFAILDPDTGELVGEAAEPPPRKPGLVLGTLHEDPDREPWLELSCMGRTIQTLTGADLGGIDLAAVGGGQLLPGGSVVLVTKEPGRLIEVGSDKQVVWTFDDERFPDFASAWILEDPLRQVPEGEGNGQ